MNASVFILFAAQRDASPSAHPLWVSRNGAGDCWAFYVIILFNAAVMKAIGRGFLLFEKDLWPEKFR
jgi:hypothetical protein